MHIDAGLFENTILVSPQEFNMNVANIKPKTFYYCTAPSITLNISGTRHYDQTNPSFWFYGSKIESVIINFTDTIQWTN